MGLAKKIKGVIRDLFRKAGYDVVRYKSDERGLNPFQDMRFFLNETKCPVIFDVGANVGQTVDQIKKFFPDSFVHSFEPSPSTYAKLNEHCNGLDGVKTWNFGVGGRQATLPFIENEYSDMSSFLTPSEFSGGRVLKTTSVKILTLDAFAKEQNIEMVHILKSDTQGFDLEVFKGAEELMRQNRIKLVYFEFIFSKMYEGLPSFDEVFGFLSERNFSLVSFYNFNFQRDLLGWIDLLFINDDYSRALRAMAWPPRS